MKWFARRRGILVFTRTGLEPSDALRVIERVFDDQCLKRPDLTPVGSEGFVALGLGIADGFFGECLVRAVVTFDRGPGGDALHLAVSSHHPPAAAALMLTLCDATTPDGALAVLPLRKRRLLERLQQQLATGESHRIRSPLTGERVEGGTVAVERADGRLGLLALGPSSVEWIAETPAWNGFVHESLSSDRLELVIRAEDSDGQQDWRIELRPVDGEAIDMRLLAPVPPERLRSWGFEPMADTEKPAEDGSRVG
jgi:hypothetical protein